MVCSLTNGTGLGRFSTNKSHNRTHIDPHPLDVTQTTHPTVASNMTECTYCASNVARHDPVFVEERQGEGQEQNGKRVPAGQFCNYACLHAYIEEEELVYGASCEWDP
jgi:hypothetical protein